MDFTLGPMRYGGIFPTVLSHCRGADNGSETVDGQPVISRRIRFPFSRGPNLRSLALRPSGCCAMKRIGHGTAGTARTDGSMPSSWSHGRKQSASQALSAISHRDGGHAARRQRDGKDPAATIGQTMDFRCSAAPLDPRTDRA